MPISSITGNDRNSGSDSYSCPPLTDLTSDKTDIQSIPAKDILHVKIVPLKETEALCTNNDQSKGRTHRLLVHHITRTAKQELRMDTGQFDGTMPECQSLARDLNNKREGIPKTPRKFLVLINPISGKGKGRRVFHSIMEPLFKACDISYDVFVSSKYGDIHNTAKTRSLEEYCGIIAAGGDGTVNEVVCGLLLRRIMELGRDADDVNCQFMPTSIPIGIVPAGTGNWLCQYIQGNSDVTTTAINIIRGKTVPLTVTTAHEPNRFLCVSALVLHIGFVGDIIHKTELYRWLRAARFKVFTNTAIFQRRLMAAELTMSSSSSSLSTPSLPEGTQSPTTSSNEASHVSSPHSSVDDQRKPHASNQSGTDAWKCNASASKKAAGLSQTALSCALGSSSKDASSSSDSAPPARVSSSSVDGRDWGISTSTDPVPPPHACSDSCLDDEAERCRGHHPVCSGEASTQMACTMDNANDHIEADVYNIFLPVTCRVTSDGRLEKCLGRNKLHLMVVKDCSLPDFIRHFVKVRDNIQGMTDFSFVETRDVTAFRLELTTEETRKQNWYMNNDGEPILLESNVFYFRVHPRMFQAFGPPED